jgi:signal transduction histidine kinase
VKSWIRLACWFSAAFLVVSFLFVLLSYRTIEGHFPQRQSPDGQSHPAYYAGHAGGSSDDTYWSRRDITRLQALYGLAMLAVIWGVAWLTGRGTDRSIRSFNEQLELIDPAHPDRKIELDETNEEIVVLKNHINELLTRMQMSILSLKQYAAKVAHELRAPLTILRLKIEQAADKVEPRLAEEIQAELLRLNLHVEQALLVARAEQGHLIVSPSRFNLDALLNDSLEDFRLLGQDQNRQFIYRGHEAYVSADPKYTKQIFYNLLTNALRHGTGPVQLRLRSTTRRVLVWIANQAKAPTLDQLDLGLGKRIVNALVNSHGNMSIQSRRYRGLYVVRLVFEA